MPRKNKRAMVRRRLSQRQCIDQFTSINGNEAPSRIIVYHGFNRFKHCRGLFMDEFKNGRPKSVPENIEAMY